jgi:hypothetical protein
MILRRAIYVEGGIFISYRREETAAHAGRLYDRLGKRFGEDSIFMDVDSIVSGDDFTRAIMEAVSSCKILLVIIGHRWLAIADSEGTRRIDNPNDWVRVEIETALQRNILVLPVLVGGAELPKASDLPRTLWPLTQRQAFELRNARFKLDSQILMDEVDRLVRKPISETGKNAGKVAGIGIAVAAAASILEEVIKIAISRRPGASKRNRYLPNG